VKWLRRIDWGTIGWACAIPLFLLLDLVLAILVGIKDYLVPGPVRRWFGDRLLGPDVMFKWGFIPTRKPFDKWDKET
jgi:hypothetical protein